MSKTDYDLSKQFQDDLIKAYNKVAPYCWSQLEAYERAVRQPAPRYYVSARQAAQILSPMVRGDFSKVDKMSERRKQLYYSLFQKVVELSEKRRFYGQSLQYIVDFAVCQPAPQFFVSASSIAHIRSFLKRGLYDDDGKPVTIPWRVRSYAKLKAKREKQKAKG